MRFTVLASGSSGNAAFIEFDGFGLLIDFGLGPRLLASRLRAVGSTHQQIDAVLLTHTHSDHWNERTATHLQQNKVPLFCHADHLRHLEAISPAIAELNKSRLVHCYEAETDLTLGPGLRVRALPVSHDADPTFGFRLEAPNETGDATVLCYAADLGTWTDDLARAFADADLLALEFNHDVGLQHSSGRPRELIQRVLGNTGHLSNEQAADLVREVINLSEPGRLRHLVQLHLSRECNRPALAIRAVQALAARTGIRLCIASQFRPSATIDLAARQRLGRQLLFSYMG